MVENFPALRATEEQLSFLSAEWKLLSGRFSTDEEIEDRIWSSVVRQYSGEGRFYSGTLQKCCD
jgi:hypothetical protein